VHDEFSVAAPVARWRAGFIAVFVVLFIVKLWIAATLSPFGDEAFYWQESRQLAWGYSDLPPLTAGLIRLGESVAGHGLLGMRWPFLLIGSALPWLLVALGRVAFDARTGWQAGLLCMALPLAGSLGVMALPDVPLTVAILLAVLFLLRAMARDRRVDWAMLGLALGLGWMTHYRAAMPMLVGLLFLLATPRGRAQWRRPGFWLAMLVAACGLIPLLVSNWQQHGAGVAFQLVDRNPWSFHVDALVQPLEQAVACTPLLYALLLWAAWQCWRRRAEGAPWDLIAFVSLGFIGLYFTLGLFADDLRFRAHWPLPGYLPLLAVLPVLLKSQSDGKGRRRLLGAAFGLAVIGQVAGMAYLGLAASAWGPPWLAGSKAFPANFVGWREAGDLAKAALQRHRAVLVADNFMLAAELDFQLDGRVPVYSLDSPLNVKHGRAPQLAIWRRDEAALHAARAGEPMLLAVDETALRERERLPWLGSLCRRIDAPQRLARLDLFEGRKRIALYGGRVPAGPAGTGNMAADDRCLIWQQAHAASEVITP
jgi:4-amino-4-deoxy-L-arabinose transferase-like glycosyltransferase